MNGQSKPAVRPWPFRRIIEREPPTLIGSGLSIAVCSVVLIAFVPNMLHDAWVSLFWPRAEAIVFDEPQRGAPEQKRGHAYKVTLRATLPDGRTLVGSSLKPLFEEIVPLPSGEYRRVPPQIGDRLSVHFDPAKPERMVPHRELARAFGIPVLLQLLAFGVGCVAVFRVFRKRPSEASEMATKPS